MVPSAESEVVLVLHGLWMNRFAMLPLSRALRSAGYAPLAPSYHSMRGTLQDNLALVARQVDAIAAQRIHFVGHSLGGLLVLALLHRQRGNPRFGRAVLLGSPLAGCESARAFAAFPGGRWLLGNTVGKWSSPPMSEIPAGREVGVIAGTRRLGLAQLVVRVTGEHDGVVRVEETRLPGLADHMVLPVSHSGMLFSKPVAQQCIAFLQSGAFRR